MINKTISHYRIIEKIGSGGMGVVYKAEDTRLGRPVALKFLPQDLTRDPIAKQRFIKEAKTASRLDHPNVCTIHEIDETDDGQLFIAMACYEGETLREKIDHGKLAIDEALNITIQVAHGLTTAHRHNIIHRDIKPGNIFITNDGQVKLLDFGLAKLAGETKITKEGTTGGTIAYMSPEQAQGKEIDTATDIWSLGVVLYEMLTGRLPFKGENWKVTLYSIVNTQPESIRKLRNDVPETLEHIIDRMMQKNRTTRYKDTSDLITNLYDLARASGFAIPVIATPSSSRQKLFIKILVPSLLVGLLIMALIFKNRIFPGAVTDIQKNVAVVVFKNLTGENSLDYLSEAIPNLLTTSLEQTKYLNVMTQERMHDLLKTTGKTDNDIVNSDLAFELCSRDGVKTIILGSFTKAGDIFATDVKVLDVTTKKLLASASSKGEGLASIIDNQIDELSLNISKSLGISDAKIAEAHIPVAEVTTSSMEAYNFFLRGRIDIEKLYFQDARKFLEKAIEIDSTFASAYLYLALAHANLRDDAAREIAYKRAKQYAKKTTEKERLYIEAKYAAAIENDADKYLSLLIQLTKKYPKEKRLFHDLGVFYYEREAFDTAIAYFNKALELDPNYAWAICVLAYCYSDQGDFKTALKYFKQYATMSPGDANTYDSMGDIYFAMGDLDAAIDNYQQAVEIKPDFGTDWKLAYTHALKEQYEEAFKCLNQYVYESPTPYKEGYARALTAFFHSWVGNIGQARRDANNAADLLESVGHHLLRNNLNFTRGVTCGENNDIESARSYFNRWMDYIIENNVSGTIFFTGFYEYSIGLLDLREGNITAARQRLDNMKTLASQLSADEIDWILYRHELLYAEILLAQDSLAKAITVVKNFSKPEPWDWAIGSATLYNINMPSDVLARAYYRKGEINKAIAEYERLVTFDPDAPERRLIKPLYHFQLARMYEENKKYAEATDEYKKFIMIMKDTDIHKDTIAIANKRIKELAAYND